MHVNTAARKKVELQITHGRIYKKFNIHPAIHNFWPARFDKCPSMRRWTDQIKIKLEAADRVAADNSAALRSVIIAYGAAAAAAATVTIVQLSWTVPPERSSDGKAF